MKLLLDENLAPRLAQLLASVYPGTVHVKDVELASADDDTIWRYAAQEGYIIVSKDNDFRQRSFVYGPPPKVVWVCKGNCATDVILDLLVHHAPDVAGLANDDLAAFLILD